MPTYRFEPLHGGSAMATPPATPGGPLGRLLVGSGHLVTCSEEYAARVIAGVAGKGDQPSLIAAAPAAPAKAGKGK